MLILKEEQAMRYDRPFAVRPTSARPCITAYPITAYPITAFTTIFTTIMTFYCQRSALFRFQLLLMTFSIFVVVVFFLKCLLYRCDYLTGRLPDE